MSGDCDCKLCRIQSAKCKEKIVILFRVFARALETKYNCTGIILVGGVVGSVGWCVDSGMNSVRVYTDL